MNGAIFIAKKEKQMSNREERNKVSELQAVKDFFPNLTSRELIEFSKEDRDGLNEIKALVVAYNAK